MSRGVGTRHNLGHVSAFGSRVDGDQHVLVARFSVREGDVGAGCVDEGAVVHRHEFADVVGIKGGAVRAVGVGVQALFNLGKLLGYRLVQALRSRQCSGLGFTATHGDELREGLDLAWSLGVLRNGHNLAGLRVRADGEDLSVCLIHRLSFTESGLGDRQRLELLGAFFGVVEGGGLSVVGTGSALGRVAFKGGELLQVLTEQVDALSGSGGEDVLAQVEDAGNGTVVRHRGVPRRWVGAKGVRVRDVRTITLVTEVHGIHTFADRVEFRHHHVALLCQRRWNFGPVDGAVRIVEGSGLRVQVDHADRLAVAVVVGAGQVLAGVDGGFDVGVFVVVKHDLRVAEGEVQVAVRLEFVLVSLAVLLVLHGAFELGFEAHFVAVEVHILEGEGETLCAGGLILSSPLPHEHRPTDVVVERGPDAPQQCTVFRCQRHRHTRHNHHACSD